jgi:hypothetical protein
MSLPGTPALLLLAACLAAPARADDDAAALLKNMQQNVPKVVIPEAKSLEATPAQCAPLAHPTHAGKICDTLDDCMALCACACRFDKTKWRADVKDDGSTTCTGLPETGVGMLPPEDATLLAVSTGMPFVKVPRGIKAIQATLDGLQHLSDHLAASENRRRLGYSVRVGSCYRRHLEDSVPECGFTLKGKYMLDKPNNDQATIEHWRSSADPNNMGLSWPGRTPHSGGYGCDIILVDSRGQDCFDWRAGVTPPPGQNGPPTCSIPARDAAAYLVDEATAAGVDAKRLTFEAWHFEWGTDASGCRGADCSAWPITGKPGNR